MSMTEQKAIEIIKRKSSIPMNDETFDEICEAYDMATQALEEMQKLREFGECYVIPKNGTFEINGINVHTAVEELEQYRAIGTVEELRELKEKAEPKKVAHQGCYDQNGVLHIWNGINGVPYDLCPSCEINLCTDGRFGRKKMNYCENCGQRLDFGKEQNERVY
jgi:hypothetical protein